MTEFIISFLIGVVCIILGIGNMRGNISTLHEYHRSRVRAEDVLPFGRLVGIGTITVGGGIMLFSLLGALALGVHNDLLTLIGTVMLFVCIAVGLGITVYAMKKYNGGIF